MASIDFPEAALTAGFSNGPDSTITSKTMMLPELRALMSAASPSAYLADYRAAVLDANVLSKRTAATRAKTFHYLRKLYALDGTVPMFSALRALWTVDQSAQPLVALLSAVARDPGLRATADMVLALAPGQTTGPAELAAAIEDAMPGRYNPSVRHHMGQNGGASWAQAGLLHGTMTKVRVHPDPTYPAAAYAMYLGHLQGAAGLGLYETIWARSLDAQPATLEALVETAAATGWLDLRKAGGMTEITFHHLDSLTGWQGN